MLRLAIYAAIGWTMTALAAQDVDQAVDDTAPPAAAPAEAAPQDPAAASRQREDDRLSEFAKTPYAMFSDTFRRPDNDEVGASPAGQGGRLAPLKYAEPADGDDPSQSRVAGNQLVLGNDSADTPGSHVVPEANFIFGEIVDLGGFTVSMRVENVAGADAAADAGADAAADAGADPFVDAGADANESFVGFGVGLSADALSDPTVNFVQQNADFFLALAAGDKLQVFQGGTQVGDEIDLSKLPALAASETRKIRAKFELSDFEAAAEVKYQLFVDGALVGTGSFTWSATRENYIGVDARGGGSGGNLLIALPSGSDGDDCVKPGWRDKSPDKTPKTSLVSRLINMVNSADTIDPDGKMHRVLTKDQQQKVTNTLLEIDYDLHRLISGDPTIAERDPNAKPKKGSEMDGKDLVRPLTDEEKKQVQVRPQPKPPGAKTPGLELRHPDERSVEIVDGKVVGASRGVNTGTANEHGTTIYRSNIHRGRARGGNIRRPRVINIPPPAPRDAEPAPAEGAGEAE